MAYGRNRILQMSGLKCGKCQDENVANVRTRMWQNVRTKIWQMSGLEYCSVWLMAGLEYYKCQD